MQAPSISEVREIQLPEIEKGHLSNGIPLWVLHDPHAEYVRFELAIEAGRYQEAQQMTAKAATLLMKEGTRKNTGKTISKIFDSRGAMFNVRTSLDHAFINFTCLTEYAEELLEAVADICFDPSFNEKEVEKYKRRQARKLDIELRKTEVVAYRELTAKIYGSQSPYGYNSTRESYQNIQRQDVIDFHRKYIIGGKKHVFLTGFISEKLRAQTEILFGQSELKTTAIYPEIRVPVIEHTQVSHYDMRGAVQTSIRWFQPLFNRHHKDYGEMFLLNVVFGGYFGSRLMKNIREDEGLTYGIYASLDTLKHSGYFYISTETRHENVGRVLELVQSEMNRLNEEPCSEEELLMVKRYIAGQFLRMIDGPLNVMKVYRTLALDNLPDHHYSELLERVWRCQADQLQEIAHSYLKPDQYSLITVGMINSEPSIDA